MLNGKRVDNSQYEDLGNEVSGVMHRAVEAGLSIEEAACVVAQVAADYARSEYGPDYLPRLAEIILQRGAMPLLRA